jgi:hypothetical protein
METARSAFTRTSGQIAHSGLYALAPPKLKGIRARRDHQGRERVPQIVKLQPLEVVMPGRLYFAAARHRLGVPARLAGLPSVSAGNR